MEKVVHNFPSQLKGLVVDDHDLIRKSISKVLRKLGFAEVIECHNGKDAKMIIDTQAVDLIICDLDLNFISGFELLDHVRTLDTGSETPFLIVTGAADKDDIIKAANKGAEEYLVKPFSPEELEAKIVKVLNQFFSPGPILGKLREAEKKLISSDYEGAQVLLTEAMKLKDNARARHLCAVSLQKQGKIGEALQMLQENIQSYPNFLKNYVTLANFYIEKKDYQNAIHALKQELELNPKQPLRQIKLANMMVKQGNPQAAIDHYRFALLENNRNPEALYGMGTAFALIENMEKSIYYFKRYRRHHPKDSRPLKAIIQFAEKYGQERVAEFVLLDEKKNHPERLDAYLLLSDFYFRRERSEEAVATLEAAIKKKPDYTVAHMTMAQYYLQWKDPESAVRVLQRYVNISKDPNSYLLLAQLYVQLKKYSQVIQSLHDGMESQLEVNKALPMLMLATFRTKQFAKTYFIRERLKQVQPEEKIPQVIAEIDQMILARRRQPKKHSQAS